MMSSWIAATPCWSLRGFVIRFWKISGADVIPNMRRRKQKRPLGVIKVVSLELSGCNGICQQPLETSTFENTLAPASFGATSSKVGRMYLSLITALFSFLRSTQILIFPLGFTTGTIGAHQLVGSVTSSMMPASSIPFNSSFTLGNKGNGIFQAVLTHYSFALSMSSMSLQTPSMTYISIKYGLFLSEISPVNCVLHLSIPPGLDNTVSKGFSLGP